MQSRYASLLAVLIVIICLPSKILSCESYNLYSSTAKKKNRSCVRFPRYTLPSSFINKEYVSLYKDPDHNCFISFEQSNQDRIIKYHLNGYDIARLIYLNNTFRFEAKGLDGYTFLLRNPLKVDQLAIDIEGACIFEKPIESNSALLSAKSIAFCDKFLTKNKIKIDANNFENNHDMACDSLLFKGHNFSNKSCGSIKVNRIAEIYPSKKLLNSGTIAGPDNAVVKTNQFKNRGFFQNKTFYFEGEKLSNSGSLDLSDCIIGRCSRFKNKGCLEVVRDCDFTDVNTASGSIGSLWKIGGLWTGSIARLAIEEEEATIGNLIYFNMLSDAAISAKLKAPVVRIEGQGTLTFDRSTELAATHWVSIKSKNDLMLNGILKREDLQEDEQGYTGNAWRDYNQGVCLDSTEGSINTTSTIVNGNSFTLLKANNNIINNGSIQTSVDDDSILLFKGQSITLGASSYIRAYNLLLDAQARIDHAGQADITNVLMWKAPDIVANSIIKTKTLITKETTNFAAGRSSNITTEDDCLLQTSNEIKNSGTLRCSGQIQLSSKYITLENSSNLFGQNLLVQADSSIKAGGNCEDFTNILLKANFVENIGSLTGNTIQIKADRLWWARPFSKINGKSLFVDSILSINTAGIVQPSSLVLNSAINLNLGGVYRIANSNINSLLTLDAGISLPKIDSFEDLYTVENAWKLGETAIRTLSPAAGFGISSAKTAYSLYKNRAFVSDFINLYKDIQELYQNREVAGASDWVALVCRAKSIFSSIAQVGALGKQGYDMARDLASSDFAADPSSSLKNFKLPTVDWKSKAFDMTSNCIEAFGPQVNKDSLVDINCGFSVGVNSTSRSVYSSNNGVSIDANKNSVTTVSGTQSGISVATQNSVNAFNDYSHTGKSYGVNTSISARNIDLKGAVSASHTVNLKAKNNINIDPSNKNKDASPSVKGRQVFVDTKSFKTAEAATISSTDYTSISAENIDNKGTIKGVLGLKFTGKVDQLNSIGNVDQLQYQGTLEGNLADTLADGNNNLLHVSKGGGVTLLEDKHDVTFNDKHTLAHSLNVITKGAITTHEEITSDQSINLKADKNVTHSHLKAHDQVTIVGENVIAESVVKRTGSEKNYEEHVQKIAVSGARVVIQAKNDIIQKAVNVTSGKGGTFLYAGNDIKSTAIIKEKHSELTFQDSLDGSTTTDTLTCKEGLNSEYTSEGAIVANADNKVFLEGTTFNASDRTYINGAKGVFGFNVESTEEHKKSYCKDGGLLKSQVDTINQSMHQRTKRVDFKGPHAPVITSQEEISLPFSCEADHIEIRAPKVAILSSLDVRASSSCSKSSNVLLNSQDNEEYIDQNYAPQYKGVIRTTAENILFEGEEKGQGKLAFQGWGQHVVLDKKTLKEIHIAQTNSSKIPTRAAVLVATMAVTMVTSGTGSSLGVSLSNALGCSSALSQAFVMGATTSATNTLATEATRELLLCNGNFVQAARNLASGKTLKKMLLAGAAAGASRGAQQALTNMGVPTLSQASSLGERCLCSLSRQSSNVVINTANRSINGQPIGEAFCESVHQGAVDVIGEVGASSIGDAYSKGKIDSFSHKVLHGGLGGLQGALLKGEKGVFSGALAGFVSETAAELLAPGMPGFSSVKEKELALGRALTKEEFTAAWNKGIKNYLQEASDTGEISKLLTATVALAVDQDIDTTITVSNNAIDNNFLILAAYGVVGVGIAYSAYSVYSAYTEGGAAAGLKQLGIEVAWSVVGSGASKVVFKVGKTCYPTARLALQAALKRSPGLKLALGSFTETMIAASERYAQSHVGKAIYSVESKLVHGHNKLNEGARQVFNKVTGHRYRNSRTYKPATSCSSQENITSKGKAPAVSQDSVIREWDQVASGVAQQPERGPSYRLVTVEGEIVPMPPDNKYDYLLSSTEDLGSSNKPPLKVPVSGNQSTSGVPKDQVGITEYFTAPSVQSAEEIREKLFSRELKDITYNELKILGFQGDKCVEKDIKVKSRLIKVNTEKEGGLEKAYEIFDKVKDELGKYSGIENSCSRLAISKNPISGRHCLFKNGNLINLRKEGKSGHVKLEITNVVENTYEKITFVNCNKKQKK